MKIEPSRAQMNASGRNVPSPIASEVPTSTGATAGGNVRGRAANSQSFTGVKTGARSCRSRSPWELDELRTPLLPVRVAALLRLLGSVEEQVRVVRELLDARQPVLVGVETRLDQPERERGEAEHLAAPLHRFLLELLERDDRVD